MAKFTTGQIAKLVALEEQRMGKGGDGLHTELQELIRRLESGGVGTNAAAVRMPSGAKVIDPRRAQAKALWDKGWGRELGCKKFEDYLASIPEIPIFPNGYTVRFPHLVLVDQRITLTRACQLLGVKFDGNDQTFVPYDPARAVTTQVSWARCQDGRVYNDRKPIDCRTEFAAKGDEFGLSAFEGISLYAQHPEVIDGHCMDLPGSVRADCRGDCAYLGRWGGGVVQLGCHWDDGALPDFGSASRGSGAFNP
ncbi:hypothetical protein HYV74_03660 [Candidatus Uhrbacteria bacterium]|nr:hypothetical protein [Candidatus Uhrbacteria bacterium]